MIIRPTADPHTVTLSLAVFGRRGGHMHARFTARYVVMHRGEDAALEVRVTPRSIRKRRHLVDGLMVTCPEDQQRMVCDFLSWWPGDWQDDCYRFRAGAELDFLREGVPLLRDNSIQVSVEEGLRDIVSEDPMRLRLDVQVKGGWFFLGVQPTVGDTVVSGAALKAAASLGRSWVSVDGKVVALPEEVDLALLAEASDGVQAVPRTSRDRVISALSLMRGCSIEADKAELLRQVMYAPSEDELPRALVATMREYQIVGHKWLKEKLSIGTGGVLADQPGLGKTVQTISAILSAIEFKPDYKVLVAAPTSLLFNWAAEFQKFSPSIASDVLIWEGKDRKSYLDYLPKSRVVLVSYATLRRDVAILGEIRFDLGVFDEAQNLKNADTASHKAVASLQCATRIALSGTPIENRLSDLHAIFAVACPGLLPPYEEFEERYAKPFREGRPEGLELMKNHVQPHILRRRKEDVLKDLPEKMIIDHYCEMTTKQSERYAEALAESRMERDNAPDASARAAVMLKVLTRLRQIATDPRLGDRTGQYRAEDSGKIQSLRTLMDVIDADDTNKVLIFSQWVESLELIRMELERRGQKYSYLTGATSDRDIQCKQFQERREFRYFLISLHAGGVGLNLTAANYVINMDPWWNPAKEAQAFDRAHRIGQKRQVTVYRMIAPGTIEDKIASMQEFKQALADGIIDDGALPQLSVRDMAALID